MATWTSAALRRRCRRNGERARARRRRGPGHIIMAAVRRSSAVTAVMQPSLAHFRALEAAAAAHAANKKAKAGAKAAGGKKK